MMTRETKIGLLVGLAFIIVIGILLSDHLSSANDPPQAALGIAGDNVREGVTTPGGAGAGYGHDALPRVAAAHPADAPSRTVNTRSDLAAQARRPSVGIVQVGPGSGDWPPVSAGQRGPAAPGVPAVPQSPPAGPYAHGPDVIPAGPADAPPVYIEPPAQPQAQPPVEPARISAPPANPPRGLRELAERHPDDFVQVDQYGQPLPTQVARPRAPAPGSASAARQYTAQPGDSVSRMASRLLGANTKANRDLIIRANPSLQGEGNVVVAGKNYLIPDAGGASPAPAAPGAPAASRPPARQAAAETTPGGSFTWYTVKENDNLTKIAAEHLGNGNAWASLLEYNKDILKDGNKLRANMRIRIPAPPVASTAN
jgi:nucleoid-associated protein YgaU